MLEMNGKYGRKGTLAEIKFLSLETVCFSCLPTLAFLAKVSFANFAMTGKFVSKGLYIDIINFKRFYLLLVIASTPLINLSINLVFTVGRRFTSLKINVIQ